MRLNVQYPLVSEPPIWSVQCDASMPLVRPSSSFQAFLRRQRCIQTLGLPMINTYNYSVWRKKVGKFLLYRKKMMIKLIDHWAFGYPIHRNPHFSHGFGILPGWPSRAKTLCGDLPPGRCLASCDGLLWLGCTGFLAWHVKVTDSGCVRLTQ